MGVVDRARGQLPPFLDAYLPASAAEFRVAIGDWISKHLSDLQLVGKDAAHMFVTLLIGMVLGAIMALQRIPDLTKRKPLAAALFDRLHLLVQAFRNIVFAQIKIAALNTVFTAVFLAVVLPLCGIHLPLTKTLIVLTFLLGLLPVIGIAPVRWQGGRSCSGRCCRGGRRRFRRIVVETSRRSPRTALHRHPPGTSPGVRQPPARPDRSGGPRGMPAARRHRHRRNGSVMNR